MPEDGSDPVIREWTGLHTYRRSARWMAWETKHPPVRKGERVVPRCGNDRCLDPKHMTLIQVPAKSAA